jgi:hypothetical protein
LLRIYTYGVHQHKEHTRSARLCKILRQVTVSDYFAAVLNYLAAVTDYSTAVTEYSPRFPTTRLGVRLLAAVLDYLAAVTDYSTVVTEYSSRFLITRLGVRLLATVFDYSAGCPTICRSFQHGVSDTKHNTSIYSDGSPTTQL